MKKVMVWREYTQKDLQAMIDSGELPKLQTSDILDAVIHIAAWVGNWLTSEGIFMPGKAILEEFKKELEVRIELGLS